MNPQIFQLNPQILLKQGFYGRLDFNIPATLFNLGQHQLCAKKHMPSFRFTCKLRKVLNEIKISSFKYLNKFSLTNTMCNVFLPQAQTKNFLQKFKRIKTCLLIWHRQDRAPGQVLPRKFLGIKPGLSLKKYNIHTVLVNQDTLHISTKCKLILDYLLFSNEKKKTLTFWESRPIWTISDTFEPFQTSLNNFIQV